MTINLGPNGWVPDSCTLPTAAHPIRVAEFDRFFTEAVQSTARPDRTRLDLMITTQSVARGRELAARETRCCSFFTFTFTSTGMGTVMHIDVPATQVEVLDAFAARAEARSR